MDESTRVRKSAVAGSFYPRDPETLRRDIELFLSQVPRVRLAGRPLVLIEPHAGYIYSGRVAAYGYRLIRGMNIRTVAVLSPSHMEYFPFASVYDGDAYETPFGRIEIDKDVARTLAAAAPRHIRLSERGHVHLGTHRQEHALEVQLPFLQVVLDGFRIVPIVMGDQDWDLCSSVGNALAPHMSRTDFLVVVSSDLSHFHGYDTASDLDGLFCDLLGDLDARRLYESVRKNECEACGAGPVIASVIAGKRSGASGCRVLHAANSGDVTGERESVVGYAAAVIEGGPPQAADEIEEEETKLAELSADDRARLLDVARSAVARAVGLPAEPPAGVPSSALAEPRGAFVTLKIGGKLRGCIGMLDTAAPLEKTVEDMARAAALEDPRFRPLDAGELPRLEVEISVLTPLRPVGSIDDIVVGVHGLVVEWGGFRGLLLPQVASEMGWDAETFLANTCQKAGLPPDAWRREDTRIYSFSAVVFGEVKRPSGA